MSYFQAIILGIIQGITELFPVSSLGHSVILPSMFGWQINQHDPFFLIFLVATHTATALVLLFVFRNDWKKITIGMWQSLRTRHVSASNPYGRLGWLLVAATVPAGILGLLFEEKLEILFASPYLIAQVLIANGFLLLGADFLRRRSNKIVREGEQGDLRIAKSTWMAAVKVGIMQCLALIPGFSRTGSTITGGLLTGLAYEDAARFSFLLATPIILAASVLKLPELLIDTSANFSMGPLIAGSIAAGIFAYLSVRFLLRYFETKKLMPFGIYCIAIGLLGLL
ncbi:MAG: undecaprenyl-diphosphate phosphatase [bacterium]|nr:undecaprenyl-diphosphate phosphatase [bacterium]MDZ4286095.1 undecaprenyl-diphosphate phosphatase [Candidatus Sungbacteria bacterium]